MTVWADYQSVVSQLQSGSDCEFTNNIIIVTVLHHFDTNSNDYLICIVVNG